MYADLDLDELEELAARNKATVNIAAELALAAKAQTAASPPRSLPNRPSRRAKPQARVPGRTRTAPRRRRRTATAAPRRRRATRRPRARRSPFRRPWARRACFAVSRERPRRSDCRATAAAAAGRRQGHPRAQGGEAPPARARARSGGTVDPGARPAAAVGRPGSRIRSCAAAELVVPARRRRRAARGTGPTGRGTLGRDPELDRDPRTRRASPPAPGSSKFPLPVPGGRGPECGSAARAQPTGLGSPQPGSGPGSRPRVAGRACRTAFGVPQERERIGGGTRRRDARDVRGRKWKDAFPAAVSTPVVRLRQQSARRTTVCSRCRPLSPSS